MVLDAIVNQAVQLDSKPDVVYLDTKYDLMKLYRPHEDGQNQEARSAQKVQPTNNSTSHSARFRLCYNPVRSRLHLQGFPVDMRDIVNPYLQPNLLILGGSTFPN